MDNLFDKFAKGFVGLLMVGLVACGNENTAGTTEETNAIADDNGLPPASTPESSSSLVPSSSSVIQVDTLAVVIPGDSISKGPIIVDPSGEGTAWGNTGVIASSSSSATAMNTSSSSGTAGFDLWRGDQNEYCVNTGVQNGENTCGYWYSYADTYDGGNSRITWPIEMGNSYSDESLDPVIELCGGVCGTYELDKGSSDKAFAGLGFNVALNDEGESSVADVSDWGGICIAYSSDTPVDVVLSLGEERDATIGYDYPRVHLPKSTTMQTKCVTWDSFKQIGAPTVSSTDASKQLFAIRFELQGESGTSGQFNISAIGTYNSVSP